MDKFRSEAYQDFLNSHTGLNYYIKISCASVLNQDNSIIDEKELSDSLNAMVEGAGQRWTAMPFRKPHDILKNVVNDLAKSGIIWVYSAFDVFFKKIEGQLSVKFTNQDDEQDTTDDGKVHKVIALYEKLNWDQSDIISLLPILRFYESLRHSVAHNIGMPSGKLLAIFESDEFNNAIGRWKTKYPGKKISPPPIVTNQAIILEPHHSITYSETCLRIVTDINKKLLITLGTKYFIEKTFKKHLKETSSLSKPYCQNLARYICYHLEKDYHIAIAKYNSVYEILDSNAEEKELKIKEYKKRYHTLKILGEKRIK